jgi:cytochrome c-type biogenesis protein CcmH
MALRKPVGKGAWVAMAAVVLAVGTIGWRLVSDRAASSPATTGANDPLAALEADAKANPGDSAGWQRLGFAYFDAGRFADASAAYGKATEAAPGNAVMWSSLGEALVMANADNPMPPRALAAFRKAAELDPKDPRARYFLAVNRDIGGDHAGAIDDWLALLAETPAGAPWEADLKRTIEQVGKINDIKVDDRIAAAMEKGPAAAGSSTHPAFNAIPGPSSEQLAAAGSIPPGEQRAMAEGMVARLEGKLASDPTNIDGWIMLMRSRKTLGQDAAASKALASAIAANPGRKAELEQAASQLGVRR